MALHQGEIAIFRQIIQQILLVLAAKVGSHQYPFDPVGMAGRLPVNAPLVDFPGVGKEVDLLAFYHLWQEEIGSVHAILADLLVDTL